MSKGSSFVFPFSFSNIQYLVKYGDQNKVLSMQLKVLSMFKTWKGHHQPSFSKYRNKNAVHTCIYELAWFLLGTRAILSQDDCPF